MGQGSEHLGLVAVHIKVLYLLIVVLIVGEIGAYYYSLYLFRSVQDECTACAVRSTLGGERRTSTLRGNRIPRGELDNDELLRKPGYAPTKVESNWLVSNDGNARKATNLAGPPEATKANIDGSGGDAPVIAVGRHLLFEKGDSLPLPDGLTIEKSLQNHNEETRILLPRGDFGELAKLNDNEPEDGGDEHQRGRHRRRRHKHHHKTNEENDDLHENHGGKLGKVRQSNGAPTMVSDAEEPAVEFIPHHDKSRLDGKLHSPDYVWLNSYSRIPVPAMQEFCRATKDYCPGGPAGPPGIPGQPGFPGINGPKGETGDLGYPGDSGQPGLQGYPGKPGPKGSKGDPGTPGMDGLDGIGGAPGLDGVPGRSGVDGRDGIDGIPGIPGTDGKTGINGTNGIPGLAGPPGPRGFEGPQGFPGPRGGKGNNGKPGAAGLPGVSAWLINGTKQETLLISPVIIDKEMKRVVTVKEGENIRIPCVATGTPPPDVSWRRADTQAIITGVWKTSSIAGRALEFPEIHREHTGDYLCIAMNGVPPMDMKTSRIEVLFPPYVKIRNQLVETRNGSYAFLECDIEAYPEPITYWMLENNTPIENSTKYVIKKVFISYSVHLSLNVTDIKRKDYGQYKCVGRNEFATINGTIDVQEYDPRRPRPTPKANETSYGKAPPKHVGMDDVCPPPDPCPTCPPSSDEFCPDMDGIYNVRLVNPGPQPSKKARSSNCILHEVGKPVYHRYTNSKYGTWLKDPSSNPVSEKKFWVTRDNESSSLYEYADKSTYQLEQSSKIHTLPFPFVGNSHVIYNAAFYYHVMNSTRIVRFDLDSGMITARKEFTNASYTNERYLYKTQISYIDFAIDEMIDNGMWAIYGLTDSNNTYIIQFDPMTLEQKFMWNITLNHRNFGDMFIVCGVLYAVDFIDTWNANILFAFDLYQNKMIERGTKIRFTNPYRLNTVIGYNPKDKVLFSWDHGHQLYYPIKFSTLATDMDETSTSAT